MNADMIAAGQQKQFSRSSSGGLAILFSFDFSRQIQVCFALATDGERRYVDLAALSALAVRRIHPRAKIIVLTDDQSLRAVSSTLEPYRLSATVRSVGEYSGETGPRSRFVKTQVRQFVDGDFV